TYLIFFISMCWLYLAIYQRGATVALSGCEKSCRETGQLSTPDSELVGNSDTIPALKVKCGRDVGRVKRETKLGNTNGTPRSASSCKVFSRSMRSKGTESWPPYVV